VKDIGIYLIFVVILRKFSKNQWRINRRRFDWFHHKFNCLFLTNWV